MGYTNAMTQKSKRHHYVPQLLLREFYNRDKQLWVYDRQRNSYRHASSAATAYLQDYYTIDTVDEKDSTEVEEVLSKVETTAKPLLAKLVNKEQLHPVERSDLAIFLALQAVRVPSAEKTMVEGTEKVMSAYMQEFLRTLATNKQAFDSFKKKMEEKCAKHDFTQKDLHKQLSEGKMPSLTLNIPRSTTVKMMFDLVNEDLAPGFNKLNWRVLEAPKNCAFVTSDNPFVNLGRGLLEPHTFKIFPLTPRKVLLIGHTQDASLGYGKCNAKQVHMFNKNIALRSERYVFSHSKPLLRRTVERTKIDITAKGAKADVRVFHSPDNSGGLIMLSNTGD